MSAYRYVLLIALVLPVSVSAQSVTCTSTRTTASCDDEEGNTIYTICTGQYCTTGSYHRTLAMRQAAVEMVYKPMFHRNALCGSDDASGDLFPTLNKTGERVRDPLLPKKSCMDNMFVGTASRDYLKMFEKNVYDLCSAKRLDMKQCGVLARDIQFQKELAK